MGNQGVCLVFLFGFLSLGFGQENLAYFSSTKGYYIVYEVEKCMDVHFRYTIVHDNFTQTYYSDPECNDEVFATDLSVEEWSYDNSVIGGGQFDEAVGLYMDDQCSERVAELLFVLEKCLPSLWTDLNSVKWRISDIGLHSDFWFTPDREHSCPAVPDASTHLFLNSCQFEKDFGAYYYYDSGLRERREESGARRIGGDFMLSLMGLLVGVGCSFGMGGKLSRVLGVLVIGLCLSSCVLAQDEEIITEVNNRTTRAYFRTGFHDETSYIIADQALLKVTFHYYVSGLGDGLVPNYCNPCALDNTRGLCHAGVRVGTSYAVAKNVYFDYGYQSEDDDDDDKPASMMITLAQYSSRSDYKECARYDEGKVKWGDLRNFARGYLKKNPTYDLYKCNCQNFVQTFKKEFKSIG